MARCCSFCKIEELVDQRLRRFIYGRKYLKSFWWNDGEKVLGNKRREK